MSLCIVRKFGQINLNKTFTVLWQNYSRRSNNNDGPYKVVQSRKSLRAVREDFEKNPVYEFLAPTKGFPFFMPGNVGPAWYDLYSTVNNESHSLMNEIASISDGNMDCQVQSCPRVLRQTVCELFPNKPLDKTELSVVTLTMRPDIKQMRLNKELETEKMAQQFVLAAQSICRKLLNAGYWADFINPFSGRPYIHPPTDSPLYATDEKFRCLDFQIISIKDCKIITNEEDKQNGKRFVGSLFTNAPSKRSYLDTIFTEDD